MRDQPSLEECTRLFHAIEGRNVELVREMLAAGVTANIVNNKVTALFAATMSDSAEIIEMLISGGAELDTDGGSQFFGKMYGSPLNYACSHGQIAAAAALLRAGANPNIQSGNDGKNAAVHLLRHTRAKQPPPWELIEEVLMKMFDAGLADESRTDPDLSLLVNALKSGAPSSTFAKLLQRGADRHPKYGVDGMHMSHFAASASRMDVVELLVKHGEDIDQQDDRGRSALFYANSTGTLDALILLGANVNHVDEVGRNCLQFSIGDEHLDRATLPLILHLLDCGADPYQADEYGVTAVDRLKSPAYVDNDIAAELCRIILALSAKNAMHAAVKMNVPRSMSKK